MSYLGVQAVFWLGYFLMTSCVVRSLLRIDGVSGDVSWAKVACFERRGLPAPIEGLFAKVLGALQGGWRACCVRWHPFRVLLYLDSAAALRRDSLARRNVVRSIVTL